MSNSELNHYFPHDSNARSDDKMLALRSSLGNKAYALYFMTLELMREEDNYSLKANGTLIDRLSMELNESIDYIEKFLGKTQKIGLFTQDNGKLYSEEFLRRMAHKDEKSKQARKAAMKRWHGDSNGDEKEEQSDSNADAMRQQKNRNANKKEKDKEKKKDNKNLTTKDKSDSKSDDPSEKYNEYAPTTSRGLNYEQIKELWNDRVPEDLQIRAITDKRKRHLRSRYKEPDFALGEIITAVQEQPFLLGDNDRGWTVDFTWIVENQDHYTNILERKYKDNKQSETDYLQNLVNDIEAEEGDLIEGGVQ